LGHHPGGPAHLLREAAEGPTLPEEIADAGTIPLAESLRIASATVAALSSAESNRASYAVKRNSGRISGCQRCKPSETNARQRFCQPVSFS
jgi:hypothetical protein